MSYNKFTFFALFIAGMRFFALSFSDPEKFVEGLGKVGLCTLLSGVLGLFFDQLVPGYIRAIDFIKITAYLLWLFLGGLFVGVANVLFEGQVLYYLSISQLLACSLLVRGLNCDAGRNKYVSIGSILYSAYVMLVTVYAVLPFRRGVLVNLLIGLCVGGEIWLMSRAHRFKEFNNIKISDDLPRSIFDHLKINVIIFIGGKIVEYGDKVVCWYMVSDGQLAADIKISSLVFAACSTVSSHLYNEILVTGRVMVDDLYKAGFAFIGVTVVAVHLSGRVVVVDYSVIFVASIIAVCASFIRGVEIVKIRNCGKHNCFILLATVISLLIVLPIYLTRYMWVVGGGFVIVRGICGWTLSKLGFGAKK